MVRYSKESDKQVNKRVHILPVDHYGLWGRWLEIIIGISVTTYRCFG